jgi:hypothetical protein
VNWYGGDEDINWWNTSWTERIRLSINHQQVRGTLYNFTVFIKITNSSMADNAQIDGDDFVFISENNTRLSHEIESYQSGTGTLNAWVKFPVLSHTENTTFWLYFSNPTCGNQEQIYDAWDDSYVSVYHLNTMTDSTVQQNTLIEHNTNDVSGMVGNCRQFLGDSSSYLHVSSTDFNLPNAFTVSCWYYSTTEPQQQYATLLNKQDSSDKHKDRNWWVSFTQDNEYTWFKASSADYDNYIQIDTNHKAVEDDEWHHVSISYDATSGVAEIILCGGRHSGRATSLGFSLEGQGDPFYIGRSVGDTNRNFKGFIDEVYVSNVQRDLNWTGTYYDMIINQSSFCSIIPSGGAGWTKWDDPTANPDESAPWSWDFPLAESEGFYEFVSIGQFENNNEVWPEDADQACEYDI